MGILALEDGLFANLLIFDYLYMFRVFRGFVCKGKGREGKGREKEGKMEGKRKRKREEEKEKEH